MFDRQRVFEDVGHLDFYRFIKSTYSNSWEFEKEHAAASSMPDLDSGQVIETVSLWELARKQQAEWDIEINRRYLGDNEYFAEAELESGDEEYWDMIERVTSIKPGNQLGYHDKGKGRIEGKTELSLEEAEELLS